MAIAMECVNVVVSKAVIKAKYVGGLPQYKTDRPNQTFLEDDNLTRVGFMSWPDAMTWIACLEASCLQFKDDNDKALDIAVIDLIKGPTIECDWIEFDSGELGPRCWLTGTQPGPLVKPNRPPGAENPTFVVFRGWPP
jgi:hypothetical protein